MRREICFVDIETRSLAELKDVGAHRYAQDQSTQVLCVCYAFGVHMEPVSWVIPFYPPFNPPEDLCEHISAGGLMVAHNCEFERSNWRYILGPRYGVPVPDYEQWHDTAAMAAALALPRSLEGVAPALGIPVVKDDAGKRLMMAMSKTKKFDAEGNPIWKYDEESVASLVEYCKQDVRVMQAVWPRLFPLNPIERKLWILDAKINDRGIRVDTELLHGMAEVLRQETEYLEPELAQITGGQVNTVKQEKALRLWLAGQGVNLPNIQKETIADALANDLAAPGTPARRALELREALGNASISKIARAIDKLGVGDRIRGELIYHGASTGRWVGAGVQMQNLVRPTLAKGLKFEPLLDLIRAGRASALRVFNPKVLRVIMNCVRNLFIATQGKVFVVADFSNIEGRVLAWLAGETWKVEAFRDYDTIIGCDEKKKPIRKGEDLYKVAYSRSFNVPVSEVDDNMRQSGKVQELSLGYQGGKGALLKMAKVYGLRLSDKVAEELKVAWRKAHPNVVQYWYAVERAAVAAIQNPGSAFKVNNVTFASQHGYLWCRLPSGRCLAYARPFTVREMTPFGEKDIIYFYATIGPAKKWGVDSTYGGKLVENITQAVARDILAEAMLRVEEAGYEIVLSVHDELITETDPENADPAKFEALMSESPAWAAGLPIAAAGWSGDRYRKG